MGEFIRRLGHDIRHQRKLDAFERVWQAARPSQELGEHVNSV